MTNLFFIFEGVLNLVDWPQSFLFLCYIYLAFLHFFHVPL